MNDTARRIPEALFRKLPPDERPPADAVVRPSLSYGRESLQLFISSPAARFFLALIVLIALGAVFLPMLCPFDYAEQNILFNNKPFFSIDPINGAMHLLGTDRLGRDIFARLWYGARVSLIVAVAAALIDCIVGALYGSIAGYMGGAVDNVMMRVLEIVSGVPYMIVVLLLMAVLPRGMGTLIFAYSLVGWVSMARLVRGQTLSLKEQDFYVAAQIMGASPWRSVFVHLIPNMLGLMIVHISLDIPGIIFIEAFLSMLGMGVTAPYPSIGIMAQDGIEVFQYYPMQLIVPGGFICMLMLSFNLLGDRLQDVLDPKIRRTLLHERSARNRKSKRVV